MILVFGGTTEGRSAISVLEEAGTPFFYSTKTGEQEVKLHHGTAVAGGMNSHEISSFCKAHAIRLLMDAAHPFAKELHRNVAEAADEMAIPVIRFERIYPPRDPSLTWIDDYSQLPPLHGTLLATTGVQSISKLKPYENESLRIIYRILRRESSLRLAERQGADSHQLCYYDEQEDFSETLSRLRPDAVLMKESGLTGGFAEKCSAAKSTGTRVIVLRRPEMPERFIVVNGPYGLRRMVEKLLPEFYPLHSGLTTGTYATAAAVAQATRLLCGEQPELVPVILPDGETIHVDVCYGDGYAYVVKESGDDPDVTNGIEIRAEVEPSDRFEVCGGAGIGRITLPGFDYPPGEPAINRGPRQMLETNLRPFGQPLRVTLSVPQGEEIAKKTFNPRLGIEGGISIIGVTGIIKPYSEEAFIQSIRKCMEIAKSSGAERVVINSGGKSESYVRKYYPDLPSQAFVEYGNYIGETLQIADDLHIGRITMGVMLGKAVKLAAGHLDTHSRRTTMDLPFVLSMLREAGCDEPTLLKASSITLARELWDILPQDRRQPFSEVVIRHCMAHCAPLLPEGELTILLIDDNGHIYNQGEL